QMIATGTFTDGSVDELTGVNWTSNPTGIVTLSANGLATPVAVGSTTIKAAKDGKEDTTTSFEVTAAELVSIEVTPATKSTPLGQTVQMIATGTFTDGSVDELTGVNWTSNPTGIVTLSANGLATPVAVGSTTIKAAKDGKEDTTTSFEVTAPPQPSVTSVTITPLSVSKSKTDLGCVSFSATANYSNNTTKSISTTASSELQSCGSNAYRVGAYTGVFSVRAVADGKSASASFTVY
ncbi:Ig-like domain-containing protein, partial [Vibrio vulnificus]